MPCWRHLDIDKRAYVPLQWAEDLQQMLALTADRVEVFEEKVHLVGFSMGGYIASLYALEYPHKIASLTLVGYCPEGLSEQELQQRRMALEHIGRGHQVSMTPARLAHFVAENNRQNAAVIDTVRAMESDLGSAILAYQIKSTTPRKDLSHALLQNHFPVNFLVGAEDEIAVPARVKQVHQRLTGSNMQVIENAGHMLPLEQSRELAQQLHSLLIS
jgi:pimeloyl-ACP methyl ester carboxylesterase